MSTVFCQRKKAHLPALKTPPFPGEVGIRIQQNISQEAWKEWQSYQTKLINEYRLRPSDPKAKKFIIESMLAFLFEGKENELPKYRPE